MSAMIVLAPQPAGRGGAVDDKINIGEPSDDAGSRRQTQSVCRARHQCAAGDDERAEPSIGHTSHSQKGITYSLSQDIRMMNEALSLLLCRSR